MADSFFGFDTSLPSHDDDGSVLDEEEYDALNDETFGADGFPAEEEDDWEQRHEQLAEITEMSRVHRTSLSEQTAPAMEQDIEASLGRLVLDDMDIPTSPQKTRPLPTVHHSTPQRSSGWPAHPPMVIPNGNLNNSPLSQSAALSLFSQLIQQQNQQQHHQQIQHQQQVHQQQQIQQQMQQVQNQHHHQQQQQQQVPRVPSVRTVEDLEREMLLTRSSQQIRPQEHQKVDPNMVRRPIVKPPPQNISGSLGELLGLFPRPPPPPHLPLQGARIVPPRFPPPTNKPPNFPHPPPQHNPAGILPLPRGPFFPHQIPPPGLMSHPPPNFRLPLPFPWLHQPPPPHPPPPHPHMQHRHQNGVHDPYAGLMSAKDKQWLVNIQILQLNSQKPYIDDFYYTAYQMKLRAARERAGEKVEAPKPEQRTLEPRAYTPAQFEGSLGKLQVVSVTAPRKIIDMEVVNSEPGDQTQPARDSRRTKQTLLELERLYLLVLRLEDLAHPLPEAHLSVTENKEELTSRALAILTSGAGVDEKVPALLCVRKGKTMMSRLLPHLPSNQQLSIWLAVVRGLWSIARRDVQDGLLPDLLPAFSAFVAQTTSEHMLALVIALSNNDATKNQAGKPPLPVALSNKFGCTLVVTILNRCSAMPDLLALQPDWSQFLTSLAEAAESTPHPPSPLVSLSAISSKQLASQPRLAGLVRALTLA